MEIDLSLKRSCRPQDGAFTLVEVMIGAVLFAGFCLTGYLALVQGFQILQAAREDLRATQILQDKTEILRLYTWDQLTNNGFVALTFSDCFNPAGAGTTNTGTPYYGTVAIAAAQGVTENYSNDLRTVTFQLSWTNNNIPHQRQLTTMVSRYGLHNYIYGP
jgi:hypothetical protein